MQYSVTNIQFRKKSQQLILTFQHAESFEYSAEFLRVYSPSAEVRGHSRQEMKLVTEKKQVQIMRIDPVGLYGIRLQFSDGHNTGLYSWDFLYEVGRDYEQHWQDYLQRLKDNQATREKTDHIPIKFM